MKYSRILSADVQIDEHPGFAVIELLDTGRRIYIERYYPTLSDVEVEIAIFEDREEVINVYRDGGEYYDSIPKAVRVFK